jgi:hypothetical protein
VWTSPAVAAAAALCVAAPAWCASVDLEGLAPGHPRVTWRQLLQAVAPDLKDQGDDVVGHVPEPLRHLAGKGEGGDLPDPQVFTELESATLKVGGRVYLALVADLGPSDDRVASNTLLALFDASPTPKLLDAAAVGLDRLTGFNDPDRIRIGPGDEALITYSEHFNSSQTYAQRLVVFAHDGKLERIEQLSDLSERDCGYEIDETPTFATHPDKDRRYWRIEITQHETLKPDPSEDCDKRPPRAYHHTYREVLRWDDDKGRYVVVSSSLGKLDKRDRARF